MSKCPDEMLKVKYLPNEGALYPGTGDPGRIVPYNGSNGIGIGRYLFNCCGAYEITSLSVPLVPSMDPWGRPNKVPDAAELLRAKQDFLTVLIRQMGFTRTFYFIATNVQVRDYAKEGMVLGLLLEMGAKMVDNTKNQVHGPAEMCLHVWAPNLNKDLIRKYVDFDGNNNPRWWVEASEVQRKEWLIKHPQETPAQMEARYIATENKRRGEVVDKQKRELAAMLKYNPKWLEELGWSKTSPKVETIKQTAVTGSIKW